MFVITVTPLNNSIFKEELSYFSKISVDPGALVLVPIKGREIVSLVIGVNQASSIKSEIKKSDFSLKKIVRVIHPGIFNPYILESAKEASRYFGVSLGMSLKFMTPKIIIDSLSSKKWPLAKNISYPEAIGSAAVRPDYLALQDSTTERIGFYRSIIRESLARNQSVFVLVPTVAIAEKLRLSLGKGIENHTRVLHTKIKDSTIISEWKSALEGTAPILYIATALFLSIPKTNLGMIIIENEGDDSYEPVNRPFINPRRLAEFIAKIGHLKLMTGDTILRTDTIHRIDNKEITAAAPLQFRLNNNIERQVIDMRQIERGEKQDNFQIFCPQIENLISEAEIRNRKICFLVGRLGLGPTTICSDCQSIVACDQCDNPLILHEKRGVHRLYICRNCGLKEEPTDHCKKCGSWRLHTLGIGTELVAKSIIQISKKINISIIDSEHTTTTKQILRTVGDFYNDPGSHILIGTEMILDYIIEPIEYTAVISLDHLLGLPGFRFKEKLGLLIARLTEITSKKSIIQTRLIDENIWQYISKGNLLEFYRQELDDRKIANWPPFSILIKISRSGPEGIVEKDIKKLENLLKIYNPLIYPSFKTANKGSIDLNLLIKMPKKNWPDEELSAVLKALPPTFVVNVEPADIL